MGTVTTEEEPLQLSSLSLFRRNSGVSASWDQRVWSHMAVGGAGRRRRGIVSVATVRGERAMCGGRAKRQRSHPTRGACPMASGEMNLLWGRDVSVRPWLPFVVGE